VLIARRTNGVLQYVVFGRCDYIYLILVVGMNVLLNAMNYQVRHNGRRLHIY
jgi:hypothetical protein